MAERRAPMPTTARRLGRGAARGRARLSRRSRATTRKAFPLLATRRFASESTYAFLERAVRARARRRASTTARSRASTASSARTATASRSTSSRSAASPTTAAQRAKFARIAAVSAWLEPRTSTTSSASASSSSSMRSRATDGQEERRMTALRYGSVVRSLWSLRGAPAIATVAPTQAAVRYRAARGAAASRRSPTSTSRRRRPAPRCVLVHGGGFVIGSRDMKPMRFLAAKLVGAGLTVCAVDYRMIFRGGRLDEAVDDVSRCARVLGGARARSERASRWSASPRAARSRCSPPTRARVHRARLLLRPLRHGAPAADRSRASCRACCSRRPIARSGAIARRAPRSPRSRRCCSTATTTASFPSSRRASSRRRGKRSAYRRSSSSIRARRTASSTSPARSPTSRPTEIIDYVR